MHLLPPQRRGTQAQLARWNRERLRMQIIRLISRFANYQGPDDEPGVTLARMKEGDVGVIFSALYQPFDEIDLTCRYGAPPRGSYFQDLLDQLGNVEEDVRQHAAEGSPVSLVHSAAELDTALAQGRTVLIHSVEGGFHLGGTEDEVRQNVRRLAERGVVCITVAHLFWRQVATNSPALPFLSDRLYKLIFRQPDEGLSSLGQAVVSAMADCGILIDITHMSERSIADTLALLDEQAGSGRIPVVATHMACRLGTLDYNLTDETIARVAQRDGVLALIACEHYISDGAAKPTSFDDSFELLCRHIDHIRDVTGSDRHVAFGSDIDGYIKPALPGLEHLGRMRALQDALASRYGVERAERYSSENALRIIRHAWGATG
jgi:microsomal dipeptidase-like Zn-dependent dipeptidase